MTFRYEGVNWEGREWYAPASIRSFGHQLEDEYPVRLNTTSDGTVASKNHDAASPSSDHRPQPINASPGVVRALDAGVSREQGDTITEALRKSRDPRIKYVIWNGRTFSGDRAPLWEWRPYTGSNPHSKHFHISTLEAGDDDGGAWQLGASAPELGGIVLPITATSATEDIRFAQHLLNNAYEAGLAADGVYGPAMVEAVAVYTGAATGNADWKAGKGIGANQWNAIWRDWLAEGASGGGVTEARVKQLIEASHIVAPE